MAKWGAGWEFVRKRFFRVVPVFWFVQILFFLVFLVFFEIKDDYLWSLLGFDFFFFGDTLTWFVPSILVCYGLAFLYKRFRGTQYTVAFVVCVLYVYFIFIVFAPWLRIFLFRIPAFVFGYFIAERSGNGKIFSFLNDYRVVGGVLVIALAMFFFLMRFSDPANRMADGYIWICTSFMAYPLCFFLVFLFEKLSCLPLLKILSFFGVISLEFYLVHVHILDILHMFGNFSTVLGDGVVFLIVLLASSVFSYIIHVAFNKLGKLYAS